MGDHVWTVVDSVPPYCIQEGYEVYNCTVCMEEKYVSLGMAPHKMEAGEHMDPTCTEPGFTVYQCVECWQYWETVEDAPALGHNWVQGTGPTVGSEFEYCDRCGETKN